MVNWKHMPQHDCNQNWISWVEFLYHWMQFIRETIHKFWTIFFLPKFQRENASASVILQSFIALIWSFTLVLVSCEFGHRLSMAYDEIDLVIDQMHWYKFSAKLWKMLPILMNGCQIPIYLRVFGSTSCTREDFKRVRTNIFNFTLKIEKHRNYR